MMASACVNHVGMSPENFLDCSAVQPSHGWLSPRISFSSDFVDEGGKIGSEKLDQEDLVRDFIDFEFCLNDPVAMLPADELFSNGKLLPLHLVPPKPAEEPTVESILPSPIHSRLREKMSGPDHYAFSPKAPRCSSGWKELLCLKKAQSTEAENQKVTWSSSKVSNAKSLKQFLHRNSRSPSIDSTLTFPLLCDSNSESLSISARASLSSSSSSGADHEDLPRFSLDSDKITSLTASLCRVPPRDRVAKARAPALRRPSELPTDGNIAMRIDTSSFKCASESATECHAASRAVRNLMRHSPESDDLPPTLITSADSPRLNASGKVIFQGLGRSSSSPSNLNGGPRLRPPGMERSYSANVRVTPLLNVPVCNLRSTAKSVSSFGLGQLFLPHKKEKESSFAAKNGINTSNGIAKTKCEKSTARD